MEIASEKQDGMDPPCIRLIFHVIGELLPRQEHTDVGMVLTRTWTQQSADRLMLQVERIASNIRLHKTYDEIQEEK